MFGLPEPLECHGVQTGPCKSSGAGCEAVVSDLSEHRGFRPLVPEQMDPSQTAGPTGAIV